MFFGAVAFAEDSFASLGTIGATVEVSVTGVSATASVGNESVATDLNAVAHLRDCLLQRV